MLAGFRSRWITPGGVRVAHGIDDLPRDGEDVGTREGPAGDDRRQRLALRVLHDDARVLADVEDVVDGGDVGVRDVGSRTRLAQETRAHLRRVERRIREGLEGDLPAKTGVEREKDLAHAAGAQALEDTIRADRLAIHATSGGLGVLD